MTVSAPAPRFPGRPALLAYLALGGLLLACVVVQVFLAGLGALVDPKFFALHKAFGDWFGLLLVPMFVVALAGRFPRGVVLATLGAFLLYWLQYVFFRLGATVAFVRAFHVVNALAIFWTVTTLLGAVRAHSTRRVP